MMQRTSGHEPELYSVGTIGFGTYHCKYDSGREGDAANICFYPRKNKITIYLMDGTARYADLLAKLGKHTITGYCLHIKKPVISSCQSSSKSSGSLMSLLRTKAQDGPIDKILWKTETAKAEEAV